MTKGIAAIVLALLLVGCTNIDTAATVERGLVRARTAVDELLQRKTAAELEGMREAADLARLAREEAARFDRAKCHAGLPALRAYAGQSEEHSRAVEEHCGLKVVPGEATLVVKP